MSSGIDDLEHFKKLAEQANKGHGGMCPSCGHCPVCGRRASPWQPYPQWPNYGHEAPWVGPNIVYC